VIKINKKIMIAILGLTVTMLALPLSAASATKPIEITDSSFTVNIFALTITPIRGPLGKVPIYVEELAGEDCFTYTGDISGTASYIAQWITHGEPGPNTKITHHGYYIFEDATVTIGDVTATGGLVIKASGNGQHPAGLWRVVSSDLVILGTEEPIGLNGQGEFLITETLGLYDVVGQLHFDS
jgi:hypothetical protein